MINTTLHSDENNVTTFATYGAAVAAGHNAVIPSQASYRVHTIVMEGDQAPQFYVSIWEHSTLMDVDADQIGWL